MELLFVVDWRMLWVATISGMAGGMAYEAFIKAMLTTPFYDRGMQRVLNQSFCIALVYISNLESTIVESA
jgi:hypothetical protein